LLGDGIAVQNIVFVLLFYLLFPFCEACKFVRRL